MAEQTQVKVELSKEQVGAILRMTAPFRTEEHIALSFITDNLVVEIVEQGNVGKIVLGNSSVKKEYTKLSKIFMTRSVLNSIYQNMPTSCLFTFNNDGESWTELNINLAGDNINVGLPIIDIAIDSSYQEGESEELLSEIFESALKRTSAAILKDSSNPGIIHLGKKMIVGTNLTHSVYKKLYNKLEFSISPYARTMLNNIVKIGATIKTIISKDGKHIIFKSDNVEYKTFNIKSNVNLEDAVEEITKNKNTEFRLSLDNVRQICSHLSIPLAGGDTELYIEKEENSNDIKFFLFDIQQRMSNSTVKSVSSEGSGKIAISLNNFMSVLAPFDDSATISFCSSDEQEPGDDSECMVIEDEKQRLCLLAFIEG